MVGTPQTVLPTMRADETTTDGSDEGSEQNEREHLDWEEVGRDLLGTELDVTGCEIHGVMSDLSRSVRNGEPLTEEKLQTLSKEVEGLVCLLRVLDASPFTEERPTPKALDRLLSEADR